MRTNTGRPPSVFDRAFLSDADDVLEVLLIRHGQQVLDLDGPTGQLIDPPLSEQGRLQARLLGEALSLLHLDAVFASPLARAFDTAQAVAKHHRLDVQVIDDLREVQVFRDIPDDQTLKEYLGSDLLKAVRHRMLTERSWDVYPYSEPSADFRRRAINAVEQTIATANAGRVAVVCHGGVINAYIGHIIGSPYDMFYRPGHTSVSIVAAGDGQRVLRLLNDEHHLRTAEGNAATY
jgi:broad specificity phosphatase PhoE